MKDGKRSSFQVYGLFSCHKYKKTAIAIRNKNEENFSHDGRGKQHFIQPNIIISDIISGNGWS